MVIKPKLPGKIEGALLLGGPSRKELAARRDFAPRRDWPPRREFAPAATIPTKPSDIRVEVELETDEGKVDVIDLGGPRLPRRAPAPRARLQRGYTPNPRLYPGPTPKPKQKRRRACSEGHTGRAARRRVFRRPVPNSRLYQPAPRRLPPPRSPPRGPWPPPPPARALDTASRAALRLAAQRRPRDPAAPPPAPPPPPSPQPPSPPSRARRLVVTLPAGMDPAARHSTSPDDCSDGADALSAPSEFLAEFLSAIMRRQYAEALKYCRLILQYEPHNATARGFHPLLQHKVQALKRNGACPSPRPASTPTPPSRSPTPTMEGAAGGSSSGSSAYSPAQRSPPSPHSRSLSHSRSGDDSRERLEGSGGPGSARARLLGGRSRSGSESGGSVASQSSLEMDSSSASAASAASRSASDTRGSTRSRSDPDSSDARDDNGNLAASGSDLPPRSDDVENDNDVSSSHIKSEAAPASALRRLRAQFACSIK